MKKPELGLLEFEVFIILVLMVIDIVCGTVDHMFFTKDSTSGDARKSLMGKLAVSFSLIVGLLILHVNDFNEFDSSINSIIGMCRNVLDGVVILVLYYELVSILAHLTNITGIDFSKIPAVKSEIETKQVRAHIKQQAVKRMKEEQK